MAENEYWIDRSEVEKIRIALNEFNEKMLLDIRTYYESDEGEWKPTKKGISISADKLGEIKEALSKLKV